MKSSETKTISSRHKIEIRVSGGLGNQLFQYAFGRAKSLRFGLPLTIIRTGHKEATVREFELGHFAIKAVVRNENFLDTLRKALDRLMPTQARRYVSEPSNTFSFAVHSLGGDKTYSGNWQSEKYFADRAKDIKEELRLTASLSTTGQGILSRLEGPDSVSIHVRRGDYAKNLKVMAKHGVLDTGYYRKAMETLEKSVSSPRYFVFSDDIAWVKANLAIPGAFYVSNVHGSNLPAHEELFLMSACAHNITANSTFSWWGAWLNSNPGKMVIAPEAWYASGIDSRDLIPASWIRI